MADYPSNYILDWSNNRLQVLVDPNDFATRKAFFGTRNVLMRPKVVTTTTSGIPDVMPGDSEPFTINFQDACRAAIINV